MAAISGDSVAVRRLQTWRKEAGEDVMATLARHVVNTRYEDLPAVAQQAAKRDVFHMISIMLQGTRFPGCQPVVDFVREQGGKEEASIINHGIKVPATNAALTSGMFAGIYDQDDCHDPTACHCGPTTVSAALAIAEREGKTMGKDVILAVALGNDVLLRLALSRQSGAYTSFITPSITFGIFGAATVAGKLLRLNEKQMFNAFGLAFSHGPIPIRGFMCSPKIMYGIRASAGILSVALAQSGVCGPLEVMEAIGGYWHTFEQAEVRPEEVTFELGKRFEGANLSIKRYPGTKHLLGPVQAALELTEENDIKPQDVERIRISGNSPLFFSWARPGRGGLSSIVSLAIVDREVTADNLYSYVPDLYTTNPYSYQEPALRPEVDEVAEKVRVFLDSDIARIEPREGVGPVVVEIATKDGKVYSKRVDTAEGHHTKSPVSLEWLAGEFRREARRAANPVLQKNIDAAIELLCNLEQVGDVSQIIKLLG